MSIAYYITSHGYGHAVRSAAILNRLPHDIPLLLRTAVPLVFLKQELARPFELHPATFDCGAIQANSIDVDPKKTLETYADIHFANQRRFNDEVAFLRDHKVRLVVSDIPPFPLRVAREVGVPAIAVANFTWTIIYERYARLHAGYNSLLQTMREEYGAADLCLRLPFSEPLPEFQRQVSTPLVCRPSHSIREQLATEYRLDPKKRWVLIYVGQGSSRFDGGRLARLPHCCFLRLGAVPEGEAATSIDPSRFAGQNVVASCNAVLAKPGYGIAADCMAAGVPLVYTDRNDFAEYFVMKRELKDWGKGLWSPPDVFFHGDLSNLLEQADSLPAGNPLPLHGAAVVANDLEACWRTGRLPLEPS